MNRRVRVIDMTEGRSPAAPPAPGTRVEQLPLIEPVAPEEFLLREARLGFVLWEKVPIRCRQVRAANVMELFLVDAALALARMRLEDLSDVMGMPTDVIDRFAMRLVLVGALAKDVDGRFSVNGPEAERVRDEKKIADIVHRRVDVLFFPQSDVVVMLEDTKVRRALRHMVAPAQAPTGSRSESVRTFLSTRAAAGRIHALPADFVEFAAWPEEPSWEQTCPCVFARGRVPRAAPASVRLSIFGRTRRGEWVSEEIDLPIGVGLLEQWQELDRALLQREVREAAAQLLVGDAAALDDASFTQDGLWRVLLDGARARTVAKRGWLVGRWPLTLSSDVAKVDAAIEFAPDDDAARELFALDQVAAELERIRVVPSDVELAELFDLARALFSATAPFDRPALVARLWERGAYGAVYRLREVEDFRDA